MAAVGVAPEDVAAVGVAAAPVALSVAVAFIMALYCRLMLHGNCANPGTSIESTASTESIVSIVARVAASSPVLQPPWASDIYGRQYFVRLFIRFFVCWLGGSKNHMRGRRTVADANCGAH